MRRGLIVAVLAVSLALPVAGPASAEVRPAPQLADVPVFFQLSLLLSQQPRVGSGFTIDPPGPYKVEVGAAAGAVDLTVMRGNPQKRAAVTQYLARGVQTPERLQATFGKFGRVSMRFRESRHRPWFGKHRRCRGRGRFVVRRGVFIGSLRFRGEDGYLKVRVHRAKGALTSVAAKCRRHPHDRPARAHSSAVGEETISGLIATRRKGVDATVFAAVAFRRQRLYFAQREENRGRLSVLRAAYVLGHGRLPVNEAVTAARFAPGNPFHGSGRYRAAPDGSSTWSGGLTADFPGAPDYPLAGPDFEATLEAGL